MDSAGQAHELFATQSPVLPRLSFIEWPPDRDALALFPPEVPRTDARNGSFRRRAGRRPLGFAALMVIGAVTVTALIAIYDRGRSPATQSTSSRLGEDPGPQWLGLRPPEPAAPDVNRPDPVQPQPAPDVPAGRPNDRPVASGEPTRLDVQPTRLDVRTAPAVSSRGPASAIATAAERIKLDDSAAPSTSLGTEGQQAGVLPDVTLASTSVTSPSAVMPPSVTTLSTTAIAPTPTPASPEPAITSAPALATPPPALITRSVTPTATIASVLDRYELAFNLLDARRAKAVWPNVNEQNLARAFDNLQQQEFNLGDCQITVTPPRAVASCQGTARYTPKIGSRTMRSESRRWTFRLVARGEEWSIEAVDSR